MNKFLLVLCVSLFFNSAFAFEGKITQSYVDKKNGVQQDFTWYISGSDIRLDIVKEDGSSYSILPDLSERAIDVLINEVGQDGKYYYFHVPLSNTDMGDVVFLEKEASKFKSYDAVDVKVLTEGGLMTLQYLPEVDFNTVKLGNYFTENLEFGVLKMINIAAGFPVSSMMIDTESGTANYMLNTTSIESMPVSSSYFKIPSKYTLFKEVEDLSK